MGRPVALLLVAAALAGCSGGARDSAPGPEPPAVDRSEAADELLGDALAERTPPRTAPVPEGFRLRLARSDHVGLAFPPGWKTLTAQDARFPGVTQMFAQLDPLLGSAVSALATPDGPMKLLGFERNEDGSYSTTASVIVGRARPGASYEEWSADAVSHVRELPSLRGPVDARRVQLPLGQALRLEYTRGYGGGYRLATVQYVVVRGDELYTVTYATTPRLARRYARLFAASARTLRRVE